MESKRSSPQPHAMEPKGKKSSPRAAAAAAESESPLSSLNPPMQGANGKDQDLYRIHYKGQSGSGQAGMADGKTQWSPSKGRTAHNKDGKSSPTYDSVDTSSCFGSSVHYGGRDYYGSSATMQSTESTNENKGNKKDPAADSHGDWWQGSFYY